MKEIILLLASLTISTSLIQLSICISLLVTDSIIRKEERIKDRMSRGFKRAQAKKLERFGGSFDYKSIFLSILPVIGSIKILKIISRFTEESYRYSNIGVTKFDEIKKRNIYVNYFVKNDKDKDSD